MTDRVMMLLDGTYDNSTSVMLTGKELNGIFCVLSGQQDPQEVVDALKEVIDAILDRVNEQADVEEEERQDLADRVEYIDPSPAYL